jgi:hypothetical protein
MKHFTSIEKIDCARTPLILVGRHQFLIRERLSLQFIGPENEN